MSDAPDPLQSARALFTRGDAQGSYRALSTLFSSGPDPLGDPGALAAAIALLADIVRSFGDAALAGKIDACRAKPADPKALYGIAYDLYEQGQFAAGSALLYRANALAPGQSGIVSELVACLEHQLRYGEGALVVDVSGLAETDPLCTYLSGFCGIMVGDLDAARARARALAMVTDPQIVFMRDALEGMLARADALLAAGIALDDRALAAWQAALSGTALLHCSPHGYPDPMRGRYAYVGDSAGLEREGLERLRALLAAIGASPARIVSAPDRSSRILATAARAIFGVPRVDWSRTDTGPGLVIAWSLDSVGDAEFLKAMHVDWSRTDTGPGLVIAWSLDSVGDAEFLKAMHDHGPASRSSPTRRRG
jgi:hypothetical protein